MLSVILLILKILGITVLSILGLILLVLLIILFVPIRYRADLSYVSELNGKAGVSWLLHIIGVNVVALNNRFFLEIRLFGHLLKKIDLCADKEESKEKDGQEEGAESSDSEKKSSKKDKKKEKNTEETDEKPLEMSEGMPERTEHEVAVEQKLSEEKDKETQKEKKTVDQLMDAFLQDEKSPESEAENSSEEKTSEEKASEEDRKENDEPWDLIDKIETAFEKLSEKLDKFREKIDSAEDKLNFIQEAKTEKVISLVLRKIKRILCSILPKKGRGHLNFGFSDPSLTGSVLALLSAFWPQHPEVLTLEPDFLDQKIEGTLFFKGRIYLCVFVGVAIRLILDPNVLYVINNYKKHF